VTLLQLEYEGLPIRWEKRGKSFTWLTDAGDLPHPSGAANLGSPLCRDYAAKAKTGIISSRVLSSQQLIKVYEQLAETSQWTGYRKRYREAYTQHREGLQVCTTDIQPTGTVTGRATSNIWVVLPRENESKIGSNVMRHIVAPDGYSLVYADFTSQESWLATLLTDAAAGKVGSNEWSRAVLYGDSSKQTSIHCLVAKQLGISRHHAKIANFMAQYFGGVEKFAKLLEVNAGLSAKDAMGKAFEFFTYLKGPQGIAKETFYQLTLEGTVSGNRSILLGRRIPTSLDAANCRKNFTTSRNNWIIQSSGVDCLHALLVGIEVFCQEYLIDAFLLIPVHDAITFAVKKGQEALFEQVLQRSHQLVKQMAYERASLRVRKGVRSSRQFVPQPIECPENQLYFEKVSFADNVCAAST
jgi:DNA polymerase gamma 1